MNRHVHHNIAPEMLFKEVTKCNDIVRFPSCHECQLGWKTFMAVGDPDSRVPTDPDSGVPTDPGGILIQDRPLCVSERSMILLGTELSVLEKICAGSCSGCQNVLLKIVLRLSQCTTMFCQGLDWISRCSSTPRIMVCASQCSAKDWIVVRAS